MRVFLVLAGLLALAGCDQAEPPLDDLVVGSWTRQFHGRQLIVTSVIDQRYSVSPAGSIDVFGLPVPGSLTRFERFGLQSASLTGCDFSAFSTTLGYCTRVSMEQGRLVLTQDSTRTGTLTSGRIFYVDYASPDVTFSFSDSTFTIPPFVIPTARGPVRVGGAIRVRERQLRANVPTRLGESSPSEPGFAEAPHPPGEAPASVVLTLRAGGGGSWALSGEAIALNWRLEGDKLSLTAPNTQLDEYRIQMDGRRRMRLDTYPRVLGPEEASGFSGLPRGTLSGGTVSFRTVYERS